MLVRYLDIYLFYVYDYTPAAADGGGGGGTDGMSDDVT